MGPEDLPSCLGSLWPNVQCLYIYGMCYCLMLLGSLVSGLVQTDEAAADWLVCSGSLPLFVMVVVQGCSVLVAEQGMNFECMALASFPGLVMVEQHSGV